jgi:hypothetical protein
LTRSNTLRHQQAFRDFIHIHGWNAPFAVTLTMKQGVKVETTYGSQITRLTNELASQNLRHFLNLLNKRVYGNAHVRFGSSVRVIPILESGRDKRRHYHLMIDCPRNDLKGLFPQLVRTFWAQTQWGYDQIDIQADADNGWINYISKLNDKPSFNDAIDWVNYNNPD